MEEKSQAPGYTCRKGSQEKPEAGKRRSGGLIGRKVRLLASNVRLLLVGRLQASVLCSLLPRLQLAEEAVALLLELVVGGTELGNSLLSQELLQGPFLNVLLLIVLELGDELDGTLEDGTFVLLAAGDDLGEFVNSLVDGLPPAALNYKTKCVSPQLRN